MGHLGHLKDEYRAFIRRLEGGQISMPEPTDPSAWQGWKDILEILLSPEDAALAAKMPVAPSSLETLSRRFGMPAEVLQARLDKLCDRGIVMDLIHKRTGRTKYVLSPPVVGFFEFSLMRVRDDIPQKRLAEAMNAYMNGDRAFADHVCSGPTLIGRSMVHESALSEQTIPDVLDWQRATSVIENASSAAVSLCYCRHLAEHVGRACQAPMENCLSLNMGADFVVRRKLGRAIGKTEALEILKASREKGLVQIADNVKSQPIFICNCCGCCCEQLQLINHYDLPGVNPSGFVPKIDHQQCRGCSRCARACPVGAITMEPKRVVGTLKSTLEPKVNLDRCIGCGVCGDVCKNHSLRMEKGERTPDVPNHPMERIIRMSLERGRLADLLFDGGSSRGIRFLHDVMDVLLRLEPARRVLAIEQVRSRFVKAALTGFPDPTKQ